MEAVMRFNNTLAALVAVLVLGAACSAPPTPPPATDKAGTDEVCNVGADCEAGICTDAKCLAPTCADIAANGDESDLNCGGSCPAKCAKGAHCNADTDCATVFCADNGQCADAPPPTCDDLRTNGSEGDVDCGGSCAAKCKTSQTCKVSTDCESGLAVSQDSKPCVCVAPVPPSCSDGRTNQGESAADCGGPCAKKCDPGQGCIFFSDCQSGQCSDIPGQGPICVATSCTDKVPNGNESDKDCGGPACAKCADGSKCRTPDDCLSSVCAGVCKAATCVDGAKNGGEIATDCGGPCAGKCPNGTACTSGADCANSACQNGVCATLTCNNSAPPDGEETDLNCGGSMCGPCVDGKKCLRPGDCTSKTCGGGVCITPSP